MRLSVAAFSAVIAVFSCSNIFAAQATYDFSHTDFSGLEPVVLGTEWEFYPGASLYPRPDRAVPPPQQYIQLPSTRAGDGFASYRIRLRLPQKAALYAVHMEAQLSAYDLWVNIAR